MSGRTRRAAALCAVVAAFAAGGGADAAVTYTPEDSACVTRILRLAGDSAAANGGCCDVIAIARLFESVPYVAHTLEVNDTERLVVNTRELDCTTFVETVTALTICVRSGARSFEDYCRVLAALRYRGGRIDGYPSRLHYFSDWIADNTRKGYVEEIQTPCPPFTATQTLDLHYMSAHPQAYKALADNAALLPKIRRQEAALTGKTFAFIPKHAVKDAALLKGVVHDGDIIAITTDRDGLDIAHVGFAVWHDDGLHLLNASSLRRRVTEESMTLYAYLSAHGTHTGIRVIRILSGGITD